MNKTRFLVCYDYGQGGLWAYVNAHSQEEVEHKFRDIKISSETPEWLTTSEQETITINDINSPKGWLATLVKD